MSIASFNIWGIDGLARDMRPTIRAAVPHVGPTSGVIAVGFQEVWFQHQLDVVIECWADGGGSESDFTKVKCHSGGGSWKCLVPDVGSAGIPGKTLELGSGLALCVGGTVQDAFFSEYRGGYVPDSLSHKGVLAALVTPPQGGAARAIVTTHLHDGSNDGYGGARHNHLQQLTSSIAWILANWRAPIVLTGDFNIDARAACANAGCIDRVLYNQLLTMQKPSGEWWLDINATLNPQPLSTQDGGPAALDMHLLYDGDGITPVAFDLQSLGSDHLLVRSTWDEP